MELRVTNIKFLYLIVWLCASLYFSDKVLFYKEPEMQKKTAMNTMKVGNANYVAKNV